MQGTTAGIIDGFVNTARSHQQPPSRKKRTEKSVLPNAQSPMQVPGEQKPKLSRDPVTNRKIARQWETDSELFSKTITAPVAAGDHDLWGGPLRSTKPKRVHIMPSAFPLPPNFEQDGDLCLLTNVYFAVERASYLILVKATGLTRLSIRWCLQVLSLSSLISRTRKRSWKSSSLFRRNSSHFPLRWWWTSARRTKHKPFLWEKSLIKSLSMKKSAASQRRKEKNDRDSGRIL